jgi:L-ascorbate metabolism protein UlaG (beta-lactamase superfamily)
LLREKSWLMGLKSKGVRIEVVPAYNLNKPYHPRGFGVGYIVELGGIRIYHAGDSDFFPEMKNLKADVALLPKETRLLWTKKRLPMRLQLCLQKL